MILSLVRAHLGNKLVWLMIAPLGLSSAPWPTLGAFGIATLAFVVPTAIPPRPSKFELMLPIHLRVVLQARLLSAGVLFGLPLLLWTVSYLLQRPTLLRLEWVLSVAPASAMAFMLSYMAPGTRRLLLRASFNVDVALRLAVLAAFCAGVVYTLPPVIAIGVLSSAAVVLYLALVRAIPDSLELSESNATAFYAKWADRDEVSRGSMQTVLMHVRNVGQRKERYSSERNASVDPVPVSDGQLLWLLLSPTWGKALYIVVASIAFTSTSGIVVLMFSFVMLQWSEERRQRNRWMLALPCSHRQRLWLQIAPSVIALSLGMIGGQTLKVVVWPYNEAITDRGQTTETPSEWRASPTRTSLAYWSATEKHTQPLIKAPWGETVAADTITIFSRTLHNPYTARESSSARFIEWQFQRASQAVLGQALSLDVYKAQPPDERPAHPATRASVRLAFGALIFALALLMVWLSETARSHRRSGGLDELGDGYLVLVFIVLGPMIMWFEIKRDVDLMQVCVDAILLHIARSVSAYSIFVPLCALLTLIAAYRLLEWQFARSETPASELAVARQAAS